MRPAEYILAYDICPLHSKLLHGLTHIPEQAPAAAAAWLPTAASTTAAVIIKAGVKVQQKRKVCQVGSQSFGTNWPIHLRGSHHLLCCTPDQGSAENKGWRDRPQTSDTLRTYFVALQIKVLQSRKAREVCPQRCGTVSNDIVATEIEVLQGRKAREVCPQRRGTLSTDIVATQIEVLQA